MNQPDASTAPAPSRPAQSRRNTFLKVLWHTAALLIALSGLAAYQHFKVDGSPTAAWASLVIAAVFGFVPFRDLLHYALRIEGVVLHCIHLVGAMALAILPLTGAVSGVPVLTHAAMAPFAIMGAAQAIMHQHQPRNPKQAEALRRFATSLPEVAAFADAKAFSSPANAHRAVIAMSDILTKAQALGETELECDPGFQAALQRSSARFGVRLALDAVATALSTLPAGEASSGAVQALRAQLASARQAVAGAAPSDR